MSSVDLLFAQVRVVLNAILESGIPRGLSENDCFGDCYGIIYFFIFKTKFFTNCCNTYQNQNNLTSKKLKSITFTRCRSQVIIASRHIPFGSSLSVYSRWRPTEGVEACVGGSIVGITPGAALTSNQLSDAILY